MKITAKKLLKALLPHGLVASRELLRQGAAVRAQLELFKVNACLHDRHAGERCFILCTGPSVRKQDLRRLAGELVISVSSAYLHPHFDIFRPAYHCVPQITFGAFTRDDATRWFADMDARLGQATVVLSSSERALVRDQGLFQRRAVNYLLLEGDAVERDGARVPDLTGQVPGPQSVPIMALMLALYIGCREIYLLGTDHDQFLTGTYTHFYERAVLQGKDPSVDGTGRVLSSRYVEFKALERLWQQYRWIKACAAGVDARIYNATAGGALDEFERVEFAALMLAGDGVVGKKIASTL